MAKKFTCRVGPRVTEGSWMFIRTDRIAWVAQALLITWKEVFRRH